MHWRFLLSLARNMQGFPSDPSEKNNSWVSQPLFHNSNVKSKIPTHNRAGFKILPLDSRRFGFPYNSNIKIIDVFSRLNHRNSRKLWYTGTKRKQTSD
jgi:hypothetical protein